MSGKKSSWCSRSSPWTSIIKLVGRINLVLSRLYGLLRHFVVVVDMDNCVLCFRFHKFFSDLVRELNKNKCFIKDVPKCEPCVRSISTIISQSLSIKQYFLANDKLSQFLENRKKGLCTVFSRVSFHNKILISDNFDQDLVEARVTWYKY